MIKLSDYVCNFLAARGVKHVFMISGGGAMHLVDSVGKHPKLTYVCPHHEQAAAIAAEGYYRASGRIAAVVVTSGPGGTNTLTGVIGQWLDSIPCIYVSGQVKQETTIASCLEVGLRQLGDQEINIVDIVRPVTKYAVMVRNPLEIRYHLEKAFYLATHGRPGPVWLDIPLDVQGSLIDEKKLTEYDEKEDELKLDKDDIQSKISQTIKLLKKAKRPVFIAGHGIRLSGAQELFLEVAKRMGMPVVSTFNGFDLIDSDNPLYVGRIGTIGDRAGNFALQNSDLLISVGSRNNIRQVSYNWKSFARAAKKVIVDIDAAEFSKPTVNPDLAIHSDARYFLEELTLQVKKEKLPEWRGWHEWCIERKKRYPVVLPEYNAVKGCVNPYYFMEVLSECMSENAIVVAGNGTACVTLFQAGKVKKGQRIFWNSGCASMGYDLPAAIGACFAIGKRQVICIAGDGSLQMNIQELQTVFYHKLPIKIFVLNNQGYMSIKQTQDGFFGGRHIACDEKSGVSFPEITKIAGAYGLKNDRIKSHYGIREKIEVILQSKGPVVCEVGLQKDYKFSPKLSSERKPDGRIVSKPLEDMYPFLDRKEFKNNLLIPEWNPTGQDK